MTIRRGGYALLPYPPLQLPEGQSPKEEGQFHMFQMECLRLHSYALKCKPNALEWLEMDLSGMEWHGIAWNG